MKGTTTSAISDSEAVNQPYLVVVGGNSAGNRAVLASLLKGLERRGTVAFILAEPLATEGFPDGCALSVAEAVDGGMPEPDHLYLCPPEHALQIGAGGFEVSLLPRLADGRSNADCLFESLAAREGWRAVGVLPA